jgi:Holliday junction DNA helicase RuvB
MEDLISSKEQQNIDESIEHSVRPQDFDNYVGQDHIKGDLQIFIQAAKQRNETLDHVVLFGSPGLGKTTLANIIANNMESDIKYLSGPTIEKIGDIAAVLSSLEPGDIVFIDEIHRIPRNVEEVLYSAMEDFVLDIIVGKESGARSIRIDLPPFTLIGATTRIGMLTAPLRDRFGIQLKMEDYSIEELKQIISRNALIFDAQIEEKGALEISRRSRGTPRIANRLLKRVRDYAQVMNDSIIDYKISRHALNRLQIDEMGFNSVDLKILKTIANVYNNNPVGLDTLSAALDEEKETIEEVHEPYLIQMGFVKKTPRGRILTQKGVVYIQEKYNN